MALFWPGVLSLLCALSTHARAAKTTLSPDLSAVIPSCAETCFGTFLETNFPSTACGSLPGLDCLCRTKTKSQYTVGEGAVQCILAAFSVGSCGSNDAQSAIAFKAYTMCSGKEDALPNTHGTLTATLVVTTSMPASSSKTSKSNFSASTAITASTTDPVSTSSPTRITTTSTFTSSTSTTSQPTSSTSAVAAAENASPGSPLTKEQVIGISVGSVAAGVLGIVGLLIFMCVRRRKAREARDSDMLPFQLDPSNNLGYSYGFNGPTDRKIRGPGGTVNGLASKVPPRVPPRLDMSSPNMFSRRTIMPDMIGVAISPEGKVSTDGKQYRNSKLLPEKPSLTLQMPNNVDKDNNGLSFSQPATNYGRQSTATQFEEDFDDSTADTAVAADDSWGRGSSDQIAQPATANLQTIRHVNADPKPPVPAFAFTGENGVHWRPGQAARAAATPAPELYVKPLNFTRGPVGSFSQPRRPNDYPAPSQAPQPYQQRAEYQGQRPQLQLTVPNKAEKHITSASSNYDPHSSLPPSESGRQSTSRPVSLRMRRSYKSTGPYDTLPSAGSLTSFEDSDSAVVSPQELDSNQRPVLNVKTDLENKRRTLPVDLSPVVESPPSGRSPVSYPKIPPRGRLSKETIRMVPPPKQPDFTATFSSGRFVPRSTQNGSGQMISPVVTSPNQVTAYGSNVKPWRAAEIQAQRERELERAEIELSKSQVPLNVPSNAPSHFPQRMQSLRAGTGQIWPENNNLRPPPPRTQNVQQKQEREYLAPSARYNGVGPPTHANSQPRGYQQSRPQDQYQAYQPPRQPQQTTSSPPGPAANQNSAPLHPLAHHPSSQAFDRSSSQASIRSQTSNASSLLAKRRGEQKALALNLSNANSSKTAEPGRNQGSKWRVLGEDEIKVAKSEGWRPLLGSGGGSGGSDNYGGFGYSTGAGAGMDGELPRTPGWVPKLTPTRRGDELFLSVQ